MIYVLVLEVVVIGVVDSDGLVKFRVYVVFKLGWQVGEQELQQYVKLQFALYKYPRWIEFVIELFKIVIGKIQWFKFRVLVVQVFLFGKVMVWCNARVRYKHGLSINEHFGEFRNVHLLSRSHLQCCCCWCGVS